MTTGTNHRTVARLRGAVLSSLLVGLAGAPSISSAGAAPVTARTLGEMSPQEVARLVPANDRVWVAKTIYPEKPLGSGIGAITLFAMPEPGLEDICQVHSMGVTFAPADETKAQADATTQYVAERGLDQSLFVVADDRTASSHDPAAACRGTPIQPDFMMHSGALNVFAADSIEAARLGVDAFRSVLKSVSDRGNTPPFPLTCDGPVCSFASARSYLAALNPHRIESVQGCPDAPRKCIRMTGFDGNNDWTLDIYLRDSKGRAVARAELTSVTEPKI